MPPTGAAVHQRNNLLDIRLAFGPCDPTYMARSSAQPTPLQYLIYISATMRSIIDSKCGYSSRIDWTISLTRSSLSSWTEMAE